MIPRMITAIIEKDYGDTKSDYDDAKQDYDDYF